MLDAARATPQQPVEPTPDLLGPDWRLQEGSELGGVLRLRAGWLFGVSEASQSVAVAPGRTYEIDLLARVPAGPAHWLRAELMGVNAPGADLTLIRWP